AGQRIETGERFPLLRRDGVDDRGGIDLLIRLQLRDGVFGDVTRHAPPAKFLNDASRGCAQSRELGARELPGEIRVVEQLLTAQSLDRSVHVSNGLAVTEQSAAKLIRGARAESQQSEGPIVGRGD